MNNIWVILLLLCCCNQSCGGGYDELDYNCKPAKNDCGCKKDYCPDQMQAMPFSRNGDGQSCCCEMKDGE